MGVIALRLLINSITAGDPSDTNLSSPNWLRGTLRDAALVVAYWWQICRWSNVSPFAKSNVTIERHAILFIQIL